MNAPAREARRLYQSARWMLRERGAKALASDAADFVAAYATYPIQRRRFGDERFAVGDRELAYVRHHYNRAWRNERSVELALAYDFLERNRGRRLIEIGNVMSHYTSTTHQVLDKYEVSPGVINEDVVDHEPATPYDAVLSISTLEHVGWDERPRQPEKVLRARDNLLRMLAPGGSLLVTCPLGQNPHLDEYIADGRFTFPRVHFLRRVNKANEWREASLDEVRGTRYGSPYRNANALFIGIAGD